MKTALFGIVLFFASQAIAAGTVAHYASAEIARDFAPLQVAFNR